MPCLSFRTRLQVIFASVRFGQKLLKTACEQNGFSFVLSFKAVHLQNPPKGVYRLLFAIPAGLPRPGVVGTGSCGICQYRPRQVRGRQTATSSIPARPAGGFARNALPELRFYNDFMMSMIICFSIMVILESFENQGSDKKPF
jgi:hypothetical protein